MLAAEPLRLEVYNPGHEAIFPVSSVIVSGEHDAILVDAQFGKAQAEQLVQRLRAGGKQLTSIYISHGDPDYYFGLDTLTRAFPTPRCWLRPPRLPISARPWMPSWLTGARRWARTSQRGWCCHRCSKATA